MGYMGQGLVAWVAGDGAWLAAGAFFALLAVSLAYARALSRACAALPAQRRPFAPSLAWLGAIPPLGWLWLWAAGMMLGAELEREQRELGRDTGEVRLWVAASAASFMVGGTLPFLSIFLWPLALAAFAMGWRALSREVDALHGARRPAAA